KGERNENETAATGVLRNHHRDRRTLADLWYEHWIARHQLRGGGAFNEEKLEDRFFAATRRIASAYGQWQWHQDRGTVEGSLRRDAFSDRAEDRGTVEGSLRRDAFSDRADETTYRLGASRFLTTHVGVKGSHATGFRPPTLYELFDPGSTLGPSAANPDLLAERSRSVDGGLFTEVSDLFYGELLAFRQSVREEIVALADPARPLLFRFQNLSRTRATGWELALNFRFPARISLDVSATRIEALILENDRNDPRDNGNRVPGVAELTWTLGLAWRREAWHAYLNLRSVGERFIDTANTRFLKGYRVADAGFGFPIGWRFEGALEGKNLTNETYAEVENFPPPGRQLFFTLRWRYGAKTEEEPPRPGEEP
ncbi:MAG: TonB-dependent receptor, partial [SAR324 cluster bacterium]|nr:TonB-dependent receptor [SAR324 cluster bacterium]